MSDIIDRLIDERAIQDVLFRLARSADRTDAELWATCFHPDATIDHGIFKGTTADFIVETVARLKKAPITQHSITNIRVDLRGDTAFTEAYVMMRTVLPGTNEPNLGWGRYIDRFERRGGEWRVAHRLVTLERAPLGFPTENYAQATKDRTDPSYER